MPNSAPQHNAPAVEAANLSIGGGTILDNVSLRVEHNDFVTIVGPNGAGKTTLLRCMLGLRKPETGTVQRAPKLKTGYVPQKLNADAAMPLSAKTFLTLHKKNADAEALRAAEETGIAQHLHKPLHALSGGEFQRVLLARALIDSPQLLALDEPAQNLDVPGRIAFYQLLSKLYNRGGIAILMVSHDLHFVMSATRQVVCLYHRVCCSGAPQTVAKAPEFSALFGGELAELTAVYHHEHNPRRNA